MLTDQHLQTIRKLRIAVKLVASVQNGHLADLFERSSVVAQLVQQNTQCPDIALLVNGLFAIDINHLRASVLQSCMALNVILD